MQIYLNGDGASAVPPLVSAAAWRRNDNAHRRWPGAGLAFWQAETPAGTLHRLSFAWGQDQAEYVIGPGGQEVWVSWSPNVPYADIAPILLGTIMGVVLRLRGTTCLHASVIAVGDQSIAFAGSTGAGKSTTAASFAQKGHVVLADDIAALEVNDESVRVHPGEPRMRLRPETAAEVFGSPAHMRPMWSIEVNGRTQKQYLETGAPGSFPVEALPLASIYVLEPRDPTLDRPELLAVSPASALPVLMGHRRADVIPDRRNEAADFATLGRVAHIVPVRRVRRPDRLNALPMLVDAVLDDMRASALA